MRIAIFSDYFLPHIGGVETSISHQARALKAAGHDVYIVSPPMKGAGLIDDVQENVMRVKSPINIRFDGMGVFLYNRHIFRQLDNIKPEIIHFQSEFNMAGLAIRYAKSRNLPLFYTAHTFITPQIEYLMKYPLFMARLAVWGQKRMLGSLRPTRDFEAVDGLFGIPCSTPAERIILDVWMKLCELPDFILAPSQRMVDYIGHYHPEKPRFLLPNPFSSALMEGKSAQPVQSPIRIVSSFVLRPEKRPEVLIEAVRLLTPAEKQKIKVDMYGGGVLLKKMQSLVKEAGLEQNITIHGPVPTSQLEEVKLNSDVLVSTSYGFDNQPMMFLEALAAGCAILFCDPYLREGTSAGNSVLVDPSPEGFARGLRQLINAPGDITRMKKASKQESVKFGYQSFTLNYENVLNELKKYQLPE